MASEVTDLSTRPWQCSLPVSCRLERDQTGVLEAKACFFMVPRTGYLMLSTAVVEQNFAAVLGDSVNDYWYFACELKETKQLVVLPWQYPIGVIVDMIASALAPGRDLYAELPLQLVLCRYNGDPTSSVTAVGPPQNNHLPHWPCYPLVLHNMRKVGWLLVRSLMKENLFGLYGTSVWSDVNPKTEDSLSQAVMDNDPRAFYPIATQQIRRALAGKSKNSKHETTAMVKFHCGELVFTRQVDTEAFPTLGFLLREYFPCCYDLTNAECMATARVPPDYARVLVMGAEPVCCTPLKALVDELCCIDLFVHIVVRPVKSNAPRERPLELVAAPDDGEWDENGTQVLSDGSLASSVGTPLDRQNRTRALTAGVATRRPPTLGGKSASPRSSDTPQLSQSINESPLATGGVAEPQAPVSHQSVSAEAPPLASFAKGLNADSTEFVGASESNVPQSAAAVES